MFETEFTVPDTGKVHLIVPMYVTDMGFVGVETQDYQVVR